MDYQELGCALSRLRRSKRISQQTMAEQVGISRATINAFENDRAGDIGIRKVLKIVDYLGLELSLKEKSAFPTLEELRDEH